MTKKLRDFTYQDMSNYCNYLWQCTTNGFTVIEILEFMKQAPTVRFFHKRKDIKKRETWWQEHKFELLNKDILDKEIDLQTWEVIDDVESEK